MKRKNPLGWGYIEDAAAADERDGLLTLLRDLLGEELAPRHPPPPVGQLEERSDGAGATLFPSAPDLTVATALSNL